MDSLSKRLSIDDLKKGCSHGLCYNYMSSIKGIHRSLLFNNLTYERLQRKNDDINAIYYSTAGDWSQTFHILLFRMMGGTTNRTPFERLAHIVPYGIIARESASLLSIEALLLGSSGLIELYTEDSYTSQLKMEYSHLANKYNLESMSHNEWQLSRIYPNNHPTLRLAQLAACYHNNRLSIHEITQCATRQDIYQLFGQPASEYWVRHFMPNAHALNISRHIGQFKSDLLGINVVAQINFAYGNYIHSDAAITRAIRILEDIPAEDNRYINAWNSYDKVAFTAFESQALLQLSREYCEKRRCTSCPLARYLLNDAR